MKLRYCRHCQKDVPMFDNDEYEQLTKIHQRCIEAVKKYRRAHDKDLSETPIEDIYQPFYDKYREVVGVEADFSVEEIMSRHFLSRWKDYQHETNVG